MVFIFWSFCLEFWNKIIYSGFNKFSGLSSIFFYSNVVNDGGSYWFDEGKYWCNEISIGIWNQNQANKLKNVVDHVELRTYNQTASNIKGKKTFWNVYKNLPTPQKNLHRRNVMRAYKCVPPIYEGVWPSQPFNLLYLHM